MNVPKKTLDDNLLLVRFSLRFQFDLRAHRMEKFTFLRDFVEDQRLDFLRRNGSYRLMSYRNPQEAFFFDFTNLIADAE